MKTKRFSHLEAVVTRRMMLVKMRIQNPLKGLYQLRNPLAVLYEIQNRPTVLYQLRNRLTELYKIQIGSQGFTKYKSTHKEVANTKYKSFGLDSHIAPILGRLNFHIQFISVVCGGRHWTKALVENIMKLNSKRCSCIVGAVGERYIPCSHVPFLINMNLRGSEYLQCKVFFKRVIR